MPSTVVADDNANNVFAGCTALENVVINAPTVSTWFAGKASLKQVTLGSTVTAIEDGAFEGCTAIESLVLNMPTVSTWFKGNTSLTSVSLGAEVRTLENEAFMSCSNITSLSLSKRAWKPLAIMQ